MPALAAAGRFAPAVPRATSSTTRKTHRPPLSDCFGGWSFILNYAKGRRWWRKRFGRNFYASENPHWTVRPDRRSYKHITTAANDLNFQVLYTIYVAVRASQCARCSAPCVQVWSGLIRALRIAGRRTCNTRSSTRERSSPVALGATGTIRRRIVCVINQQPRTHTYVWSSDSVCVDARIVCAIEKLNYHSSVGACRSPLPVAARRSLSDSDENGHSHSCVRLCVFDFKHAT